MRIKTICAGAVLAFLACPLAASDWPNWRGPGQDAVSDATGLVSTWSQEGENLIWSHPFTGRSTPVAFDGRVCANGRAGEGIERQGMVACFDAESGDKLWEFRFPIKLTTVPWNRVGWSNPVGDPETGYLYLLAVDGDLMCFDRQGKVVWELDLLQNLGFYSGYGGRTQTPMIDGERLILATSTSSWGDLGALLHRFFAFDKRSGEMLWFSAPGGRPADLNSQSTPVKAEIDGRRLLIHGNGDGAIYAVEAHTGRKVWGFQLSKRAINTTVLVDGYVVYAAHSEENIDEATMGRVVAIDGRGEGDITKTNEIWRAHLGVGFASPVKHGGTLYVVDNSANLYGLNAETGKVLWEHSLGRVGKGSPVFADGKIYATEVNGRFLIVKPGENGAETLDLEELEVESGRYAEVYGSPAVAYGRVYFTTEGGIYCLGDKSKPFPDVGEGGDGPAEVAQGSGEPAVIRVAPAEIKLSKDGKADFRAMAFDSKGNPLGERKAEWSLDGLSGEIDENGAFTAADSGKARFGKVIAKVGDLSEAALVRVYSPLPLEEDFEGIEAGGKLDYMIGARVHFTVQEHEGNKVLVKTPAPRGIHKHRTYIGDPEWSGYTIQADLYGNRDGRRIPDMGVINAGYIMDMMFAKQQIQLRSWPSELRMARQVDFEWETERWYTMKLRVDVEGGKAIVRGKVWPRGAEEPSQWMITAEDPKPVTRGSPGLYGFSFAPVYYDNVKVVKNQ